MSISFGGTYGDGTYRGAASDILRQYYRDTLRLFDALLDAGVCREQARGVLPQSMYTEYYGTVNLSNLLKFIDLRIHEGAQWEIQELAKGMLKIAESLWPTAINTYLKTKEN
jgi:thymidylate synthase (FAD)